MSIHPTLRRQRGISLLEVLIGVVLLSIAGSILMVTSRTSVIGQRQSKVYGDAATATKEVLEQVQIMPLKEVDLLNKTAMKHSQGPSVSITATVRSLVDKDVANIAVLDTTTLRHLTIDTKFMSKSGANAVMSFTTILYRP